MVNRIKPVSVSRAAGSAVGMTASTALVVYLLLVPLEHPGNQFVLVGFGVLLILGNLIGLVGSYKERS